MKTRLPKRLIRFLRLLKPLFPFLVSSVAWSISTTYISGPDDEITLRSLHLTAGRDNLNGIYSRPLSDFLGELIESDRFIELKKASGESQHDLTKLRSSAEEVRKALLGKATDGLLHLQITKGEMGLHFELGLFTLGSGLLWGYADQLEPANFNLDHAQKIVRELYRKVLNQIPYQGLVLSRTGNKVTINRGFRSGEIRADQEISVVQIVGFTRHPQFQFVTHIQKEIVGQIRVVKVDANLSFGYVLYEKEPQVVQPGFKLLIREPVFYPQLATSKNQPVVDHLLGRPDASVIMRGDSKEWLPENQPIFGRAQLLLGLGEFGATTHLSESGLQQKKVLGAMNVQGSADLWMTQQWYLRGGVYQGSAQIQNPLPDSRPKDLNFSLQSFKLALGHDLGVSNHVYGPRLQAMLGYSQFLFNTTESSPLSYTSLTFIGPALGFAGYLPWQLSDSRWGFGAEFWYHLFPSIQESPVSSGEPKNSSIIEVSGSAYYHWKPNLYWVSKFSIETIRSDFRGPGSRPDESARSTEYHWRRLNMGLEYLF